MITNSFDSLSPAKINPSNGEQAVRVDACIITFSWMIEKYVLENYECRQIGVSKSVTGDTPIWQFEHGGKRFAFFKSFVGAPACVATIEDTRVVFQTDKYILFGGSGCLNKDIARGRVMVPTAAYRDEGTSYHYAPASDYIDIPTWPVVKAFMKENGLPYAIGKTWTTDATFLLKRRYS